jgi:hypothetical protein
MAPLIAATNWCSTEYRARAWRLDVRVKESFAERRLNVLVTTAPKAQLVSIDLTIMGNGRTNLDFFVLSICAYTQDAVIKKLRVPLNKRKIFPLNPTDNDTVTVFNYF